METINQLQELNYAYLLFGFITILAAWKAFASLWESTIGKLLKKLDIETKGMREKREEHELLIQTAKNVSELSKNVSSLIEKHKQDMNDIYNDNLKYRDQSREIKSDIISKVENISLQLDTMQKQTDKRFLENEKKENKRVQNDIKDKIAQSYRHYDSVKQISDMELEALEGLIETYESYGGENSFVHSIVQKEMYTWNKIDRM